MDANAEGQVSDDELMSQSNTFVLAGAETTSTAMCRILHQLALQPVIQDALRQEIVQALASSEEDSGRLEYTTLMTLPYLDAVCKETLRMFPPTTLRNRRYGLSASMDILVVSSCARLNGIVGQMR